MSFIRWLSHTASQSAWIRKQFLGPKSQERPNSQVEGSPQPEIEVIEDSKVTKAEASVNSGLSISAFFSRWSTRLSVRLILGNRKLENLSTKEKTKQNLALSLRVAQYINHLERPMFYLSAFFLLWLVLHSMLFGLSLMFPGLYTLQYYSDPATNALGLILAPMAVGYGTNWLAIKMLFHPRHPNPIWQGLIPAKREELIESISDGILTRLISPEIVKTYLHQSGIIEKFIQHLGNATRSIISRDDFKTEFKSMIVKIFQDLVNTDLSREEVSRLVEAKVQAFTGSRDMGEILATMLKGWWGPKLKVQVLKILPELPQAMDGILNQLDPLLDTLQKKLELEGQNLEAFVSRAVVEGLRNLDIRAIVKQQLAKMDEQELEKMLTGDVVAELVFIQVIGGVFGALIGVALLFPPLRLLLIISICTLTYQMQKYSPKSG